MMTWRALLHQDVGTAFQEVKGHTLEGDVVGVAIKFTATWGEKSNVERVRESNMYVGLIFYKDRYDIS